MSAMPLFRAGCQGVMLPTIKMSLEWNQESQGRGTFTNTMSSCHENVIMPINNNRTAVKAHFCPCKYANLAYYDAKTTQLGVISLFVLFLSVDE